MLPRILLVGLLAAVLVASGSGCCMDQCGMRRGPLGRPMRGGGPIDCECGGGGCGMCARPCFGPLQFLRYRATCGTGCGEMYVDEWASDPPDCQDPCAQPCRRGWGGCGGCGDSCGASCGDDCGGFARGFGFRSFWGRRYRPGNSYGGFHAGSGMMHGEGAIVHQGEWIDSAAPQAAPQGAPHAVPSQTPTPAARQTQSAIKKTTSRQPYYEPAHQHPSAASRAPAGFRTATNPYPMSSGRVMR